MFFLLANIFIIGGDRSEITSELCKFWNCEIWIKYLSTNLSICSSLCLSTNHPSYLSTHPSINIYLSPVFYRPPYLSIFNHLSQSTIYLRTPGKVDYIAWLTRWRVPIIHCLWARHPGHPGGVSVWVWKAVTRVSQHLKVDGKYFRLEEWEYLSALFISMPTSSIDWVMSSQWVDVLLFNPLIETPRNNI